MTRIKQQLAQMLAEALDATITASDIETPDPEHGDFAFPVMKIAGQKGENPRELAQEAKKRLLEESIAQELVGRQLIDRIDVAGPGYLNITLDRPAFAELVQELLQQENLGVQQQDGRLLLEFSSPNVAKPMHVGHLRNNALGDSLQRILRFVGYDVTSENYLGDWGTQYGKLIQAFKDHGSMDEFEEDPMEHMFQLYVTFHDEAEENDELEAKGREWSQKIEEGDEEARELWQMFRNASIDYHNRDYDRMDIHFDRITGESTVVEETAQLLQEGKEQGVIQEDDDGSLYIEFDDLPDTILKRSDGSTLYLSRDLANLRKRNREGFDHNLYIVASEQDLHFKQLFAAAEKLGIDASGSEHISYGLLSLPEGSMSSRKGRIIRLSDALDEAVDKAEEKIKDRDIDAADEVGIGAVKYANLSVTRPKDIEFDWEQVLSFEGDSGPYLQYANTRAKSILRKADTDGELTGTVEDSEHQLLKTLAAFPETVENAASAREPAKIANYLSSLSEHFNTFYHSCPVINAEDEEDTRRRLAIVQLFVTVTDQGLELLGIQPLEDM